VPYLVNTDPVEHGLDLPSIPKLRKLVWPMSTTDPAAAPEATSVRPAVPSSHVPLRSYILLWLFLFWGMVLFNGVGGRWLQEMAPAEINEESTRLAQSLIGGRGFVDPYPFFPTGPSSHVAPLYPLTYAGVLLVFGPSVAAWWAIRLLTIGVYAGGLALLPSVAKASQMPSRVGIAAAVALSLIPLPGSCFKWDSLFDAAFFIAATAATLSLRPDSSVWKTCASGALWGIGMLFSPVTLPLFLLWIALLWLFKRLTLQRCLVLGATVVLLILPWTIRNYVAFHRLVPLRSNFGLEVSTSNNDCAVPTLAENIQTPCAKQIHPNLSPESSERLRVLGDPAFNAAELERAKVWVRANPVRFARLTMIRTRLFWAPVWPSQTAAVRMAGFEICFWTFLAAVGVVLLWWQSRLTSLLFGLGSIVFSLPYCINQIDFRHRYPALWIQVLLGCYAIYRIADAVRAKAVTASEVGPIGIQPSVRPRET
jgi:hypothetical protein